MSARPPHENQSDGDSLEEQLKQAEVPEVQQEIEEEKVDDGAIQVEEVGKEEMKEDEGEGDIEEEAEAIDEESPSVKDEMADEQVQEAIQQEQQVEGVKEQVVEEVPQANVQDEQAINQNNQMEEEDINSNPAQIIAQVNQPQAQPVEMEEEKEDVAVVPPQQENQKEEIDEPQNQQDEEAEEQENEDGNEEGNQEDNEEENQEPQPEAVDEEIGQEQQQPNQQEINKNQVVEPQQQQVAQVAPQRSSPIKTKPADQQSIPLQPSPIKQHPNLICEPNIEQIHEMQIEKQNQKNRINEQLNASNLVYINRLQRKLEREILNNRNKAEELKNLSDENKKVRIQLITSKASNMELKKKELQLKTERGKLQREVAKLKEENAQQKTRLEEVQKIGDVYQLKNNLEQLQVLFEAQQGEIEELRRNPEPSHFENNFAENLAILSARQVELNKYKQENKHIRQGFSELIDKHRALSQQHEESIKKNALLEQEISNLTEQSRQYSEELTIWQKKWQAFEDQRAETKRARELEQKVTQYESQRHFGDQSQIPIIPTLSLREEKDLLLREYLVLETNYQNKNAELEIANARLNKLDKEYRNKLSNSIRKKQYTDLMAKYNKAKNCLESAFEKIRKLEKTDQTSRNISEHVQELLEGNQATHCHNLIRTTTQQLQQMQQRVEGLQMSDALMKSQQENVKNKRRIAQLEEEIKTNDKLMQLLNEDNEVKTNLLKKRNTIIDKLKTCHSPPSHIEAELNKAQQQVKRLKDLVTVYETKSIILIRENQSLNGQFQHWKRLYYSIKDSLSHRIQSSLVEVAPTLLAQEREELQVFTCAQCELRKLIEHESAVAKISQGTQTENLSDLHLKEIRELLGTLKKVQKVIDEVPKTTDSAFNEMNAFKEKYDRYVERYQNKQEELRKEKEENDKWRLKAKDEIREEFQDIRDLITNNRLANALRTAKNLIDYLEKENNQEEPIEEENDSAEKKE